MKWGGIFDDSGETPQPRLLGVPRASVGLQVVGTAESFSGLAGKNVNAVAVSDDSADGASGAGAVDTPLVLGGAIKAPLIQTTDRPSFHANKGGWGSFWDDIEPSKNTVTLSGTSVKAPLIQTVNETGEGVETSISGAIFQGPVIQTIPMSDDGGSWGTFWDDFAAPSSTLSGDIITVPTLTADSGNMLVSSIDRATGGLLVGGDSLWVDNQDLIIATRTNQRYLKIDNGSKKLYITMDYADSSAKFFTSQMNDAHLSTAAMELRAGGVILPRVTTAEMNAIPSPENGELLYNVSSGKFCGYAGSEGQNNGVWTVLH